MNDLTNPYIDGEPEPTLKQSVVAYIDILGYLDIVKEAEKEGMEREILSQLQQALGEGKEAFEADRVKIDDNYIDEKDISQIVTFTDNIVIGTPISTDGEGELFDMYWKLSMYQLTMVLHGFFIRGAISIGNMYMDDYVVFGNGLIEAYECEKQIARDPRIVLSNSARKAVEKQLTYFAEPEHSPQANEFLCDSDGQFFLNYLDIIMHRDHDCPPDFDALKLHKKVVKQKLSFYRDQPKIWSKYAWVANYHNYFCDQHDFIKNLFKIDLSDFHMKPTRIA